MPPQDLFAEGEQILKAADGETVPQWMIARSQLAAAHFDAARTAAALNGDPGQALPALTDATDQHKPQDPAPAVRTPSGAPMDIRPAAALPRCRRCEHITELMIEGGRAREAGETNGG